MLTAKDILGSGLRVKKVKVPEWGPPGSNGDAFVYCRPCDALTHDRAQKMIREGNDGEAVTYVAWRCVCDKDGNRLFDGEEFESFRETANIVAANRAAEFALSLAGFGEEPKARKKK